MNCSSNIKIFANSWLPTSNFKSFSQSLEQFFLTVLILETRHHFQLFGTPEMTGTNYFLTHYGTFCHHQRFLVKMKKYIFTWKIIDFFNFLILMLSRRYRPKLKSPTKFEMSFSQVCSVNN